MLQLNSSENDRIIDDVTNIMSLWYPESPIEELRNIVWTHWFYGTMDVIYKNDEISSVIRWNISGGGRVCDVIDFYIKDGENGFRIIKHLAARNWHRFPALTHVRFARQFKYPGREMAFYPIKKLLHIKEK